MQRLTERFPLHTAVEIRFAHSEQWHHGRVIQHDPPGLWVQTSNGRRWFVTNGRRIRPYPDSPPTPDDT